MGAIELSVECEELDKVIKETAILSKRIEQKIDQSRRLSEKTQALIKYRQGLIEDDCSKNVRREASKLIQSGIKKDLTVW